jgi:hypothetical protein
LRIFSNRLLRKYRALAIEGELRLYLIEDWDKVNDFDVWQSYGSILSAIWGEIRDVWPTDLRGWYIFDVSVISAALAATKISVMCRDESFAERAFQARNQNSLSQLTDDSVKFIMEIRWEDFQKYRYDNNFRSKFHGLIADSARSEIALGRIELSSYGNQILGDLDEEEYPDDEDDKDPFVT